MHNLGSEMLLEDYRPKDKKMLFRKDKLSKEEKPTFKLRKSKEIRPCDSNNGRKTRKNRKIKERKKKKTDSLK